jgi:hypothetical protein
MNNNWIKSGLLIFLLFVFSGFNQVIAEDKEVSPTIGIIDFILKWLPFINLLFIMLLLIIWTKQHNKNNESGESSSDRRPSGFNENINKIHKYLEGLDNNISVVDTKYFNAYQELKRNVQELNGKINYLENLIRTLNSDAQTYSDPRDGDFTTTNAPFQGDLNNRPETNIDFRIHADQRNTNDIPPRFSVVENQSISTPQTFSTIFSRFAYCPEGEGYFSEKHLKKEREPDSLFHLKINNDSSEGTIEIIGNSECHRKAINAPAQFLFPVCSYNKIPHKGANRIHQLYPGKIKKSDRGWEIDQKISITFE